MTVPKGLRAPIIVAKSVFRHVLVEPVREGVLQYRLWPSGLMPLAVLGAVGYLLAALLAVFAGPIRRAEALVNSYETDSVQPALASTVLLAIVFLAWALVVTGSLHGPWYLKVVILAMTFLTVLPVSVGVLGYYGLVTLGLIALLMIVRWRRPFAWWEFPLVTLALLIGTHLPWIVVANAASFGLNPSTNLLSSMLTSLAFAALPAVMAAGAALAQLAVLAADSAHSALSHELSRTGWWVLLAATAGWRIVDVGWGATQGARWLQPAALLTALAQLTVAALLVWLVLRLARRPFAISTPEALDESGPFMMLAGSGFSWPVLLLLPAAVLNGVATTIGATQLAEWTGLFRDASSSNLAVQLVRGLFGVVLLAVAVHLARRGRQALSVIFAAFTAGTTVDAIAALAGLDSRQVADPLCVVAPMVALVLAVWLASRRLLDGYAAWGLGMVLLVCAVYPHRGLIADPVSALLGFTGIGVMVFGLIWRVLTDGAFANNDSRSFPRPVRVLLFLGYLLFAMCVVAFLALTRSSGTDSDVTAFAEQGDDVLGVPLLLVAILAGLSVMVRRRSPQARTVS